MLPQKKKPTVKQLYEDSKKKMKKPKYEPTVEEAMDEEDSFWESISEKKKEN